MTERIITVKVNGKTYSYRAVFELDEDGIYVVEVPAIEGCFTQGVTFGEALEMIEDALILSLECRMMVGEEIPLVEYEGKRPSSERACYRKKEIQQL